MLHRVHFDRRKNRCPGQGNVPHPAIKDKQAQNGQSMQAIPAEQAHQSEAHGRDEQDVVMDDAGD